MVAIEVSLEWDSNGCVCMSQSTADYQRTLETINRAPKILECIVVQTANPIRIIIYIILMTFLSLDTLRWESFRRKQRQ